VLHPEKFLLERRRIAKHEVITDEVLMNTMRESYKRQGAYESQMMSDLSKTAL
jgi:hypothetical protein